MALKTILVLIAIFCTLLFFVLFKTNGHDTCNEIEYHNATQYNDGLHANFFENDFKYILNANRTCELKTSSKVLAVIVVTSYFSNIETRAAMRKAFPPRLLYKLNLRRVFLLGVAPQDKYKTQTAITQESTTFGDLIQGNFKEAYRNLTYKHLMGLQWASTYCKQAQYIIKMDDDIVVNLYKIVELLNVLDLPPTSIAGYILEGMVPIREPTNKWFVTHKEYDKTVYPKFVSGWFYVTNPNVCESLMKVSKDTNYFWIDDIYVTGILAEKLQIKHYNLGNYFTVFPEILQCCERDLKKFNYDCEILVGPNGGDANFFYHFNRAFSKCYYNTCTKRTKSLNSTCIGEKKFPVGKGNSVIEKVQLTHYSSKSINHSKDETVPNN